MTAPDPGAPRQPFFAFDALVAASRRLTREFGATIQFAPLDDDIGEWDGRTRTVTIDVHSPLADQLHFVLQCWELLAIGWAASDLELVPHSHLHVVR